MGLFAAIGAGIRALSPVVAKATALGGRTLRSPITQGLAAGVAGTALATQFAGDGQPQQFGGGLPSMAGASGQLIPFRRLSENRIMALDSTGAVIITNNEGKPIKPMRLVAAGMPMPGNVKDIVFISGDRTVFGVTLKRARKSFGGEIKKVSRTIRAAKSLVNLCERKKKRAS